MWSWLSELFLRPSQIRILNRGLGRNFKPLLGGHKPDRHASALLEMTAIRNGIQPADSRRIVIGSLLIDREYLISASDGAIDRLDSFIANLPPIRVIQIFEQLLDGHERRHHQRSILQAVGEEALQCLTRLR